MITNIVMPFFSVERIMSSRRGGKTRARNVPQTAPSKLSNKLRFGMSFATVNVTRTIKLLNINSVMNGFWFVSLLKLMTDGNMI